MHERTENFSDLKVAIVHYWLVGMRGGERVLEELCHLFPQADIYTHAAKPENLSENILRHRITETFIARLPGGRKHYQKYLPLMPYALEALDLRGYDLVISSESGPAKGVITDPDCTHVCYCHSPMRYIWDQYHIYKGMAGKLTKAFMPHIAHHMRIWDQSSAARVDRIVANSKFVSRRIEKSWGRKSTVVHPPVDLDEFLPQFGTNPEDFYLYVGEIASYKRVDMLVDAFNESGRKLVIIGTGSERKNLIARAKPNITFLGRASFDVMKSHYAKCRALIFPGIEDFGIVPLEAMASGRPVIAFGRGGAKETILDGITGMFFYEPSALALNAAISKFEEDKSNDIDQVAMRQHVLKFSKQRFRDEISFEISAALSETAKYK